MSWRWAWICPSSTRPSNGISSKFLQCGKCQRATQLKTTQPVEPPTDKRRQQQLFLAETPLASSLVALDAVTKHKHKSFRMSECTHTHTHTHTHTQVKDASERDGYMLVEREGLTWVVDADDDLRAWAWAWSLFTLYTLFSTPLSIFSLEVFKLKNFAKSNCQRNEK